MRKLYAVLGLLLILNTALWAGNNTVEIKPTLKKYVGDHSTLDRTRYFYIHSTLWDAETQAFFSEYNVNRGGRGFWGPGAEAKRQTGSVATYPADKTPVGGVKEVTRYVATEHPGNVFKDNMNTAAYADWVVEYFQNWAGTSGRPEYFEPMNEPFVHAKDFYDEPDYTASAEERVRGRMAELFRDAGKKIKETPELKNMKVIGYASAYPALERNDFGLWESNWKMFMDVAGDYMDAWCVHLYDGINVVGQDSKRSGSNADAILDIIETYSWQKWNKVKPFAIDEYGGIEKGNYDSFFIQNAQSVRSQNSFLFQLLDRQDRMEISIPFTGDKSTWHLTAEYDYQPYGAVLWVDKQWLDTGVGRPANQVTEWVYTDRIYFFELWKNVKGDRVEITTSNPDVQAQAFVDGNKMYVGLNNLDENSQTVYLSHIGNLPGITSVLKKSLAIPNSTPVEYNETTTTTAPESVTLSYGETVMFEYTFESPIQYSGEMKWKRYYSEDYLKGISTYKRLRFDIDNVEVAANGYASLSMSIGRKLNMSKKPTVKVNGTEVDVPNNWKGYDQEGRDDFFGNIEIQVPINLIEAENNIDITFDDNGGHVSTVVLNMHVLEQSAGLGDIKSDLQVLEAYPNPTDGLVYLSNVAANTLIEVFSMDGIQVMSQHYDGTSMDISRLQQGIYFVKGGSAITKLMLN